MTVAFDDGSSGRLDAADALTNWTAEGATPTQETDYFYQNIYCISCQVKTAEVGFYLTCSSTAFDSGPKVLIAKIIQTNYGVIDGNGLQIRIGSGTGAYYYYYVFTAATYPIAGGWQIVPIDPNVAGFRTGNSGSPNLAAVVYIAIRSDASATAKAPNLGMDAVDYVTHGSGLTCTGTSQTFDDFIAFDEGTSTNRYGLVTTKSGIIYVVSTLTIGSATATTFTDSNRTIVFPDGRFNTGFSGLAFDLQNASTDIALTSCTFIGRGSYGADGSTADTRPVIDVSGTTSTNGVTFDACSFLNFNDFTLSAKAFFNDCVFVQPNSMTQNGASIDGCTFDQPTVATGVAFMDADSISNITNCDFISSGTGHAIVCTSTGTYDWSMTDSGYTGTRGSNPTESSGSNDAMFFNNSGGLITLNIQTGALQPSVRNGSGASTVCSASYTLTITDTISGTDVTIVNSSTRTELKHEVSTGANITYTHSGGETVDILINHLSYDPNLSSIYSLTLPNSDSSIKIQQIADPNYVNP